MGVVGDAEGVLAGVEDVGDDTVHADGAFHLGEDVGSLAAHLQRVAFHDGEVGADRGGEVDFVDDQEVALGDAGAAFARDFVAAGDVDDLDGEIREFPAEAGGEVVATGLDEEQFGSELAVQVFEGEEVGGDVLANGGVRAAAGFDGTDSGGFQGAVADEELSVFAGEDVVGDGAEAQAVAEGEAELEHERGFAAADRTTDTDGEGASGEVAGEGAVAEVEVPRMIEVFVGVAVGAVGVPGGVRGVVRMRMRMRVRMRMRMRRRGHGWEGGAKVGWAV